MFSVGYSVKSKYKQQEHFDCRSVPSVFETVTTSSINRLCYYVLRRNRKIYKKISDPNSLLTRLTSVVGQFDHVYNRIESDYMGRKNNLDLAYEDGVVEVGEKIADLDILVDEHIAIYAKYRIIYEKINGTLPNNELEKTNLDIKNIEQEYSQISAEKRGKNNE